MLAAYFYVLIGAVIGWGACSFWANKPKRNYRSEHKECRGGWCWEYFRLLEENRELKGRRENYWLDHETEPKDFSQGLKLVVDNTKRNA